MSCQPLGVPSRREAPSAVQLRSGWNQSRPRTSRPNAAAAAGAAAAGRQLPTPEPQQLNQKRKRRRQPQRSQSAAVCAARPSRARGVAINVNAAQNACRASQLGVPSRREAPSAVQLRSGWNQSRPRTSRPNAAAAAGAAAAGRQLPTPEPQPAKSKKKTPAPAAAIPERGCLRRPGPRAREGSLLTSTPPKTRVVPASWGSRRAERHLVPSSCDRGGIKADPVPRDPTRPQQPAPPQRGGSCQRPNPSPAKSKKKTPAPAAAIPERGCLRRPGPRAREGVRH